MSNYKVGDMIRLTRQSLKMSQEELCENICSVQTLSRIENGKVNVKRAIYQQLMERMGRIGTKSFCSLSVEDFDILDVMVKADTAISRHEYEEAENYINQLKPELNLEDNIVNIQYIRRKESIINYRLKRITKEEFLKQLKENIALTVPNYERLLEKVYPFRDEEVQILMNIATAFREFRNFEKSTEIIFMLIRSLNTGYMGQKDAIQLKIILISNLAKSYGELKEHEKAIHICKNAIKKSKDNKLVTMLPNLYAELSWNIIQQIKKGERDKEELNICKIYLRQGYAAANISKQYVIKSIIENYYKDCYREDIYFCSPSGKGDPYN